MADEIRLAGDELQRLSLALRRMEAELEVGIRRLAEQTYWIEQTRWSGPTAAMYENTFRKLQDQMAQLLTSLKYEADLLARLAEVSRMTSSTLAEVSRMTSSTLSGFEQHDLMAITRMFEDYLQRRAISTNSGGGLPEARESVGTVSIYLSQASDFGDPEAVVQAIRDLSASVDLQLEPSH